MKDRFYFWYYKYKDEYNQKKQKRKQRKQTIEYLARRVKDNSSRRVIYDSVIDVNMSVEEMKSLCYKLQIPFYVEKTDYETMIFLKD